MFSRTACAMLAAVATASIAATPAMAACQRLAFSVNDYGKDGPTKDAKDLLDKYIVDLDEREGHRQVHRRQEGREVRAVPQLHRLRRAHLPGERAGLLGRLARATGNARLEHTGASASSPQAALRQEGPNPRLRSSCDRKAFSP